MGAAHRQGREGGLSMGGTRKSIPKVSREEFEAAIKEIEKVFRRDKSIDETTKAASRTITNYARMKEAETREKRKRILGRGRET